LQTFLCSCASCAPVSTRTATTTSSKTAKRYDADDKASSSTTRHLSSPAAAVVAPSASACSDTLRFLFCETVQRVVGSTSSVNAYSLHSILATPHLSLAMRKHASAALTLAVRGHMSVTPRGVQPLKLLTPLGEEALGGVCFFEAHHGKAVRSKPIFLHFQARRHPSSRRVGESSSDGWFKFECNISDFDDEPLPKNGGLSIVTSQDCDQKETWIRMLEEHCPSLCDATATELCNDVWTSCSWCGRECDGPTCFVCPCLLCVYCPHKDCQSQDWTTGGHKAVHRRAMRIDRKQRHGSPEAVRAWIQERNALLTAMRNRL
jgi:hypothetical protein